MAAEAAEGVQHPQAGYFWSQVARLAERAGDDMVRAEAATKASLLAPDLKRAQIEGARERIEAGDKASAKGLSICCAPCGRATSKSSSWLARVDESRARRSWSIAFAAPARTGRTCTGRTCDRGVGATGDDLEYARVRISEPIAARVELRSATTAVSSSSQTTGRSSRAAQAARLDDPEHAT